MANDRTKQLRTAVAGAAGLCFVVALLVGFAPVRLTLDNGNAYTCGSGFLHSGHTWQADTRGMGDIVTSGGTVTPRATCPGRVYVRRNVAITLLVLALVGGVALLLTAPEPTLSVPRRRLAPMPPDGRPSPRGI